MKRKKHTPEQIVKKLREAEMELAKGAAVADVARKEVVVSEQTYDRWKQQYGGAQGDQRPAHVTPPGPAVKRLHGEQMESEMVARPPVRTR